jgi:hypothetical protein
VHGGESNLITLIHFRLNGFPSDVDVDRSRWIADNRICICHRFNVREKLAVAKPLVYCKRDRSTCVKGAKQLVFYFQKDGSNAFNVSKMSTYNEVRGFSEDAQNGIFEDSALAAIID